MSTGAGGLGGWGPDTLTPGEWVPLNEVESSFDMLPLETEKLRSLAPDAAPATGRKKMSTLSRRCLVNCCCIVVRELVLVE